jgi:DNA-binding MarR family transcriptional regulator
MLGSPEGLEGKTFDLIDRISKAYEYVLRRCSSRHSITALQAELLLLAGSGGVGGGGVTRLSRILLVTQPTVSDAISALARKGLIVVSQSDLDKRVTRIKLSERGGKVLEELKECLGIFEGAIKRLDRESLEDLFKGLVLLAVNLYIMGVVREARMCLTCRHLREDLGAYYCSLLKIRMNFQELKVDCQDHELISYHFNL